MPGHVRLRAELDEVLDMDLIKQEVSQGALDLSRLAGYVINTMGSLCAPVRDAEVRGLRQLQGPVELFRCVHFYYPHCIDFMNQVAYMYNRDKSDTESEVTLT